MNSILHILTDVWMQIHDAVNLYMSNITAIVTVKASHCHILVFLDQKLIGLSVVASKVIIQTPLGWF